MKNIDPIKMEVIRNALSSVSEQMSLTIVKTAYSTIIREILDFSTALFDAKGRIVAPSAQIPFQMNSMSPALEGMFRYYPLDEWNPGDVFLMNDPYLGAGHLPDILTYSPIFYQDQMVAIAGSLAHHIDIGGRSPGSYGGDVTEIFQEGLRIPPIRLYESGKLNKYFMDILKSNIREPKKTEGDVGAQVAALRIGEKGFLELVEKHGIETVASTMNQLLDYSERRMRAKIAALPDGEYECEDYVDDDGIDDTPIKVKVKITIEGDNLTFDFTGSSKQRVGPINATLPTTLSAVYYTVIALLDPDIPQNHGCYRPIKVIAPEGSVTNVLPPAPVVGRVTICHRMVDAIFGAFSQVIPEKVTAGYYGMSNVYSISGFEPKNGKQWVFFDIEVGGWGARYNSDGPDCYSAHLHNLANTPIEMVEVSYPLRIEKYELRQDSGGPGKYRGGMGVRRDLRVLTDATVTTQSDRFKFPAKGFDGGKEGSTGRLIVNPDTKEEVFLKSKTTNYNLFEGDLFSVQTQGGGGYGNPRHRERELVEQDLREKKISPEQSEQVYGYKK